MCTLFQKLHQTNVEGTGTRACMCDDIHTECEYYTKCNDQQVAAFKCC